MVNQDGRAPSGHAPSRKTEQILEQRVRGAQMEQHQKQGSAVCPGERTE